MAIEADQSDDVAVQELEISVKHCLKDSWRCGMPPTPCYLQHVSIDSLANVDLGQLTVILLLDQTLLRILRKHHACA